MNPTSVGHHRPPFLLPKQMGVLSKTLGQQHTRPDLFPGLAGLPAGVGCQAEQQAVHPQPLKEVVGGGWWGRQDGVAPQPTSQGVRSRVPCCPPPPTRLPTPTLCPGTPKPRPGPCWVSPQHHHSGGYSRPPVKASHLHHFPYHSLSFFPSRPREVAGVREDG